MTPRLKFIGQPDIEASFAIALRDQKELCKLRGLCEESVEAVRRWYRLGVALLDRPEGER